MQASPFITPHDCSLGLIQPLISGMSYFTAVEKPLIQNSIEAV